MANLPVIKVPIVDYGPVFRTRSLTATSHSQGWKTSVGGQRNRKPALRITTYSTSEFSCYFANLKPRKERCRAWKTGLTTGWIC
jgi:hypothetical protein